MPWPNELATLLKSGLTREVEGEEEGRNLVIRRTLVRYLLLSYVPCLLQGAGAQR